MTWTLPARRAFFIPMLYRFAVLLMMLTTFFSANAAFAFDDPTKGKPFFPWLWEDQIKRTAREAWDVDGAGILFGTAATTVIARQYDQDVRVDYGDNRRMPRSLSATGSILGNGGLGLATAVSLLVWDQPEGLKLSRAILFTAASHITIATIVNRERPNNGPRSFPSGHTSTSFALAGSLAYSYGAWVGVPALAIASFVGASRIADNAHWLSDTIAAAGLGLFWARASAQADLKKGSLTPQGFTPAIIPGGLVMNWSHEF